MATKKLRKASIKRNNKGVRKSSKKSGLGKRTKKCIGGMDGPQDSQGLVTMKRPQVFVTLNESPPMSQLTVSPPSSPPTKQQKVGYPPVPLEYPPVPPQNEIEEAGEQAQNAIRILNTYLPISKGAILDDSSTITTLSSVSVDTLSMVGIMQNSPAMSGLKIIDYIYDIRNLLLSPHDAPLLEPVQQQVLPVPQQVLPVPQQVPPVYPKNSMFNIMVKFVAVRNTFVYFAKGQMGESIVPIAFDASTIATLILIFTDPLFVTNLGHTTSKALFNMFLSIFGITLSSVQSALSNPQTFGLIVALIINHKRLNEGRQETVQKAQKAIEDVNRVYAGLEPDARRQALLYYNIYVSLNNSFHDAIENVSGLQNKITSCLKQSADEVRKRAHEVICDVHVLLKPYYEIVYEIISDAIVTPASGSSDISVVSSKASSTASEYSQMSDDTLRSITTKITSDPSTQQNLVDWYNELEKNTPVTNSKKKNEFRPLS